MDFQLKDNDVIQKVRDIMRFHVGVDNRITRRELVERIFGGAATRNWTNNNSFDRVVRAAIEEIRETEFICSSSKYSGYWVADNMDDVMAIANDYVSRARAMEDKARLLKARGAERFGLQMGMSL